MKVYHLLVMKSLLIPTKKGIHMLNYQQLIQTMMINKEVMRNNVLLTKMHFHFDLSILIL